MRRAFALALTLTLPLVPACNEAQSNELAIELVTASAGNPASEFGPDGTLIIRVEQEGRAAVETESSIRGGTFDIPIGIESVSLLTRIAVELRFDDDTTIRRGAVPWFLPYAAGVVRIPVGEPGTCESLSGPTLLAPRLDPAVLPFDSAQHWVLGGLGSGGNGNTRVGVYVPIWLTIAGAYLETTDAGDLLYPTLSRELREAHAVLLTASRALVVGDTDGDGVALTITRSDDLGSVEAEVASHPGTGAGSTVVDLGASGAAIVGGGTEADRSRSVSWVDDTGAVVDTTQLVTPRTRPGVAEIAPGVLLVAGGQAEGELELEIVRFREDGTAVSAHTELRDRPIVVAAPSALPAARGSALVIGGTDASDRPIATTLVLTGCATAGTCAIADGPTWERPRAAPAVVETDSATLLLGGALETGTASDAVDRAVYQADGTLVLEQGMLLDEPRARAAAVEVGHGIVVLVGGETGPGDPALGFEMCWPRELEGLDFP